MLKGLNSFVDFLVDDFLAGKRLVYIKAAPWKEGDVTLGSKVTVQIIEDNTAYAQSNITNFGEQIVVKMREVSPSSFTKIKPFSTEIEIRDVERAVVYGEYRNQLSIIGVIAVKSSTTK